MQIHELPEYSGDPATNDVFPIDTGTHTFKLPFAELGEAIITTVSATISGVSQTVKAAIEALATRMTTAEGKITTAEGKITSLETLNTIQSTSITFLGNSGTTIYKYGKIVQFQFFGQPKTELTSATEVTAGTLPDGYKPKMRVCFDLFSGQTTARLQITFNTNGNIVIYNHGTTYPADQGWIRSFFTFISA